MPLSKETLRSKFVGVFEDVQNRVIKIPNPSVVPVPLIPIQVANALALAYHEWAQAAIAGGMIPVGGNPTLISSQLSTLPMMAGWGPGLAAYWAATVWSSVPPGTMVGVSIPAIMAKNSADIVLRLLTPFASGIAPKSKEEFADTLADILSSNTKMMTVTQTVVQTGLTAVVTVS